MRILLRGVERTGTNVVATVLTENGHDVITHGSHMKHRCVPPEEPYEGVVITTRHPFRWLHAVAKRHGSALAAWMLGTRMARLHPVRFFLGQRPLQEYICKYSVWLHRHPDAHVVQHEQTARHDPGPLREFGVSSSDYPKERVNSLAESTGDRFEARIRSPTELLDGVLLSELTDWISHVGANQTLRTLGYEMGDGGPDELRDEVREERGST